MRSRAINNVERSVFVHYVQRATGKTDDRSQNRIGGNDKKKK